MLRYRGMQLIRTGFIGVVLVVLVILVGLSPEKLSSWTTSVRYQALFDDAGGLAAGNDVTISGIKVGSVSNVALQGRNAVVTFTLDGTVSLGSDTTAHVRTGTLLGERVLTLESKGDGTMRPMDVIPVSRTASPYSLTEAVSELTTNTAGTDTGSLNQSLDTLSGTLDQLAPQLGPTFDGLTRLSQAINDRDDTLGAAAQGRRRRHQDPVGPQPAGEHADSQRQRSGRGALRAAPRDRRVARPHVGIVEAAVRCDPRQRAAAGADAGQAQCGDGDLEKNRDNIGKALPGLAKFQTTLGETIGNGPYYQAYVPNLDIAEILQPFLDYAFGFRRGTNAGQPPDNAGPRAELPFPYNGIPGPGEQWGPPR